MGVADNGGSFVLFVAGLAWCSAFLFGELLVDLSDFALAVVKIPTVGRDVVPLAAASGAYIHLVAAIGVLIVGPFVVLDIGDAINRSVGFAVTRDKYQQYSDNDRSFKNKMFHNIFFILIIDMFSITLAIITIWSKQRHGKLFQTLYNSKFFCLVVIPNKIICIFKSLFKISQRSHIHLSFAKLHI